MNDTLPLIFYDQSLYNMVENLDPIKQYDPHVVSDKVS